MSPMSTDKRKGKGTKRARKEAEKEAELQVEQEVQDQEADTHVGCSGGAEDGRIGDDDSRSSTTEQRSKMSITFCPSDEQILSLG